MNKDTNRSSLESVKHPPDHLIADLLSLMRKMHKYAMDGKWDDVDRLNQSRFNLLFNIHVTDISASSNNNEVQEILLLDKAVLNVTAHALDAAASQVLSASKKSMVCQKYQAVSLVKNNTQ